MMFKRLRENIASIRARDPAARSALEILLCYPGLHACMFYNVAHWFWVHGWLLAGRFVSHLGRWFTGIEIHPGAKIGRRLFIDHGMGLVIGETAEVGDDVTLYQGVTLGGISLNKGKRHPTLKDGVIVGLGAAVLGPIVVGENARVGANAVVLSDVPDGATVVGIPARVAAGGKRRQEFAAYGLEGDLPDPVVRAIENLRGEIAELVNRVKELEAARGEDDERKRMPTRRG